MRTVSLGDSVAAEAATDEARGSLRTLRLGWEASALGLAAIFFGARVVIALSPLLRETYYDEALTGLMSLQILRGVPQVFYWGQPYLGAVDAYLGAATFQIFGSSTLALRLGTAGCPCSGSGPPGASGAAWPARRGASWPDFRWHCLRSS
jgi:hypothetical protein